MEIQVNANKFKRVEIHFNTAMELMPVTLGC